MELHNSIGYLVNIAARFFKRNLDNQLSSLNLTTSQWSILKILSENGSLSQAQIARLLHSDRATCGTIIDKLINKNLVIKELDQDDRRSYVVSLLPETDSLVSEISALAQSTNITATNGLTEEELITTVRVLETVINNLEETL